MQEVRFIWVMLASLLASAVTGLGVLIISRYRTWAERRMVYFKSFAAGVLVTITFLHLIPEAFEMQPSAPAWLLAGFVAIYLFDRILNLVSSAVDEEANHSSGITPVLGIGLHSFIDGMIYTVTFNVSIFTGVLAAIGMILHEFPEGVVSFVLLKQEGMRQTRATTYALIAVALSTPLGTLLSFPFVHNIGEPVLGTLLALTAGVLVYVSIYHLLPAIEEDHQGYSILALAGGVLVAVLGTLFGE